MNQFNISLQVALAFAFGVIGVITLLVIAIFIPNPTPFAYTVFRIILALAAAGIGAMLPGFLNVNVSASTLGVIRAGGALALFVIVYFASPAVISQQATGATPTPDNAPTQSQGATAVSQNCTITSFSVEPALPEQSVDTALILRGSGDCTGSIRAAKITAQVDDQEEVGINETGGDSAKTMSAEWKLQKGSNKVCYKITDVIAWEAGAEKCETIVGK